MISDYDVIVVGAGPGGACTASFLARDGHRVLLIDKARFPRRKACGDAISGKSASVLRELGIQDLVEAGEHLVTRGVHFSSPAGHAVTIPFPRRPDLGGQRHSRRYDYLTAGYVIRREVFDAALFRFARSLPGVDTLEKFLITGVEHEAGQVCGVRGRDEHGRERSWRTRAVVGADGALSTIARAVGAFDHDPAHWVGSYRSYFRGVAGLSADLEIHFIDDVLPGYFWIFPLAGSLANVGIGVLESEVRKSKTRGTGSAINMRASMYRTIQAHPRFRERFAEACELPESRLGWLLPLGSKQRAIHGDGWLLVGDAAALIDPFSGEGIGNAMVSGRFAAAALHAAMLRNDLSAQALATYETSVRTELDREFRSSHQLQGLLKHRRLVDFVLRRAAARPAVQHLLASMLADYEQKEKFADLRFYARLVIA